MSDIYRSDGATEILLDMLGGNAAGAIERQEAREQQKAVARQRLPIDGTANCRPQWEALGFVFGERGTDDLFCDVTFPEGWKLKPTDHSMWSDLLDDQGRKRAAMFYKGAFYDRAAHVNFVRRFEINTYEECPKGLIRCVVRDRGEILKVWDAPEPANEPWAQRDVMKAVATGWLAERYPNWQDASAYWDTTEEAAKDGAA